MVHHGVWGDVKDAAMTCRHDYYYCYLLFYYHYYYFCQVKSSKIRRDDPQLWPRREKRHSIECSDLAASARAETCGHIFSQEMKSPESISHRHQARPWAHSRLGQLLGSVAARLPQAQLLAAAMSSRRVSPRAQARLRAAAARAPRPRSPNSAALGALGPRNDLQWTDERHQGGVVAEV